jgi:hypothetical protein
VVYSCSEPYVTEDELKLMLRGAEQSGAIEHEEQVLILLTLCFIFMIIIYFLFRLFLFVRLY